MPIEYRIKTAEELKESIGAGARSENPNLDKAKEFLGDIWSGTKFVASKGYAYAGEGVKKVGGKLEETGITQKVSSGAKTVGNKTVEYGGIAYNKTKEGIIKIATNEIVKNTAQTTISGAKNVGKSVWGFFSKAFENKPDGGDNNAGGANNQ